MPDWREYTLKHLEECEDGLCDCVAIDDAVTIAAAKILERFKIMFGYWRLQAFWYDGREYDDE